MTIANLSPTFTRRGALRQLAAGAGRALAASEPSTTAVAAPAPTATTIDSRL